MRHKQCLVYATKQFYVDLVTKTRVSQLHYFDKLCFKTFAWFSIYRKCCRILFFNWSISIKIIDTFPAMNLKASILKYNYCYGFFLTNDMELFIRKI